MRLEEAYSHVTEVHARASPNLGFIRQLKRYDNEVFQVPVQKYACKMCRVVIFTHLDIMTHAAVLKKKFKKGNRTWERGKSFCSSIFVTQLPWMGDLLSNDGKLFCPKCNAKLGQYLLSGLQCSCGRFVCPAFQMHISSIDEVPQSVHLGHIGKPRFVGK
mmetsp:Transcript_33028/g.58168  ORF Transcript_33028/g.58168 Transcript_33028/m.58168 type:complete len:160 (+) Transcript_33028:308-787(+)